MTFKYKDYEVVLQNFSQGWAACTTGSGWGDVEPPEPVEVEFAFYQDGELVEVDLSVGEEQNLLEAYYEYCRGS